MSFKYLRKMPSVEEILNELPLSSELKEIKKERDRLIKDVFTGKSDKFVLIIGPCSAHNADAVCTYVDKLAGIQEKVKDKLILIPRIYTNKPRTTGIGYKGMAHQPDPLQNPDMIEGLKSIRKMHIRSISQSHLTAADEMLYPENYPYLEDILSYSAIGARSVENQQHRLTVSGVDTPVGMKNPTGGDLTVMINAVQAAQASHVFIYNGQEVRTSGNPLAHVILRGYVTYAGLNRPNYHYEDMTMVADLYKERNLQHPAIIVDTNHANSAKLYKEQPRIAKEVLYSRTYNPTVEKLVKGFMIESYLEEGTQKINEGVFGKSITDPCLGWDDSERLIFDIAELV